MAEKQAIFVSYVSEVKYNSKNEPYTPIKTSDGKWINLNGQFGSELKTKMIDIEARTSTFKGKETTWAKVIGEPRTPPSHTNKGGPSAKTSGSALSVAEYLQYAERFANAAKHFFTDDSAKAAFVNTAMISVVRGDVKDPEEDEDSDVPF